MRNTTDIELGFGKFVIAAGQSVPTDSLSPEAQDWYLRHGCVDELAKTPAPAVEVVTTTLDDATETLEQPRKKEKKTRRSRKD